MKKFITFFLLLSISVCQAQKYPKPLVEGKVIYSEVVQVDSTSKEELYRRAKVWIANSFQSAKAVIDLDEKESQNVIGKGNIQWSTFGLLIGKNSRTVKFTFYIKAKDNKVKIEFKSIELGYDLGNVKNNDPVETYIEAKNPFYKGMREEDFKKIDDTITNTIADFKQNVSKKAKVDDF